MELKLINIFKKLKPNLEKSKVFVSIEPNPRIYGCNFINKLSDAYRVIKKVRSKNVRIQIDTGCMSLEKENFNQIEKSLDLLKRAKKPVVIAGLGAGATVLSDDLDKFP